MHGRPAGATARPMLRRGVSTGGAALFAGSLAYFLFSYAVTFGEIAAGPIPATAVATNVALFSLFAVHHSLFARERVRSWIGRMVAPEYERSLYVWVASLMLIAVCALWQPIPGVAWQVAHPMNWLLHAVQMAGVWLSIRSAALLDIWELAGVRPPGGAAPAEFRTNGPYGWIRHPIYLGWFLIVFAVATMTMTRLVFALVSGGYVLIGIQLEERALRRAPGGRYADYMRKVPHKLLPGVY